MRERLLCFYTVFQCSSHYFGISLAGSSLDVHQGINNSIWVVSVTAYKHMLQSKLQTLNWASLGSGCPCHMHNTHTHKWYYYFIITLSYGMCAHGWCVCECVCYYVELCLILLLVMCLSYRYGRQSTPEHNYLALQKSLCPQGKTEQRETVMFQAVGQDMHIGIVFITTQMMGVSDSSKTVRLRCECTK